MTPHIVSVNSSSEKGTTKTPVPEAEIDAQGIVGDAHAGAWHRQVSLLSRECVVSFGEAAGTVYRAGDFAENLTIAGIDLGQVALRDCLICGDIELEVTQIGKACHGDGCAVFRQVGTCIMPKEGIFCRVRHGGRIRPGDPITHHPRPLRVRIVTVSDRASRGVYEDRSGPAIEQAVVAYFAGTRWHLEVARALVPDEAEPLRQVLSEAIAGGVEMLVTTGGTGISPRDITPDVVTPMLDKALPGIMDFVRIKHGERLPAALLSRSVAGVAGQSLIYVLPGSVKAVTEYLAVILPTVEHSLLMLSGIDSHG